MKHHNADTCFGFSNELYIGSWFGHDVYEFGIHDEKSLLATYGSGPGEYATWVGNSTWFEYGKTITYQPGNRIVPISEHLVSGSVHKAFLMGFAAIYNRKKENKNVGI